MKFAETAILVLFMVAPTLASSVADGENGTELGKLAAEMKPGEWLAVAELPAAIGYHRPDQGAKRRSSGIDRPVLYSNVAGTALRLVRPTA